MMARFIFKPNTSDIGKKKLDQFKIPRLNLGDQ